MPIKPLTPRKPAFSKLDIYLAVALVALVAVIALVVVAKREDSPSSLSASRAGSPGPSEPANATPTSPDPAMPVTDAAATTVQMPVYAPVDEDAAPGEKQYGDDAFRMDLPQHLVEQNAMLREKSMIEQDNPDRSALTLSLEEVDSLEKSGAVIQ